MPATPEAFKNHLSQEIEGLPGQKYAELYQACRQTLYAQRTGEPTRGRRKNAGGSQTAPYRDLCSFRRLYGAINEKFFGKDSRRPARRNRFLERLNLIRKAKRQGIGMQRRLLVRWISMMLAVFAAFAVLLSAAGAEFPAAERCALLRLHKRRGILFQLRHSTPCSVALRLRERKQREILRKLRPKETRRNLNPHGGGAFLMMKKYILQVVVLIGLLSLFTTLLSGCGAPEYKVDYDGGKIFYEDAQDFYPAGAQVELIYTLMPSDLDISFYLNDEYLDAEYDGQKGYILRFTMPEEDVLLECRSREPMTYVEPGVLLVDYYRKETAGDGYYELVLSTTTDPNQYQIDQYRREEGGEETRVSYLLPFDIQSDYLEIAEEYGMREWESETAPAVLDGVLIVCKFRDGEEIIRVSSDQMPENGEEGLQKIRELLEECMREEWVIPDEMREEAEW